MKSLNINLHYDIVLSKIIPCIKGSYREIEDILYNSLDFMHLYYKHSETFYYAHKLLLMIENAKNNQFLRNPKNKNLVAKIKGLIYP
jgi:hypothetical protein